MQDNGNVDIVYEISDGNGGIINVNNSFEIEAVNDIPYIDTNLLNNQWSNIIEDTPYTFYESDLLEGFIDVDGDELSVAVFNPIIHVPDIALVGEENYGYSFIDNGDGSWTFTPEKDQSNVFIEFEYFVIDHTYHDKDSIHFLNDLTH